MNKLSRGIWHDFNTIFSKFIISYINYKIHSINTVDYMPAFARMLYATRARRPDLQLITRFDLSFNSSIRLGSSGNGKIIELSAFPKVWYSGIFRTSKCVEFYNYLNSLNPTSFGEFKGSFQS